MSFWGIAMEEPELLDLSVKEGFHAEGRCSACHVTITVFSRKRSVAEYLQQAFGKHIETNHCPDVDAECEEMQVLPVS
jgi:hypothetical protein